jgi:hypothetical protein
MMDAKERQAAVVALGRWFETQGIEVADAVPVMGEAMVIAISLLAEAHDTDFYVGFGAVVGDMAKFARSVK